MSEPLSFKVANPDELFDVVNLHDQVVGQAPRRVVHAEKMVHRATHVLIYDEQGRFFLQRRSLIKDSYPGCWDSSCSGHVDSGEDYVTAARRELGEELGWHDTRLPLQPLVKTTPCPENGYEFIQIFLMGPLAGPFVLHPEEILEGKPFTADEMDRLVNEHPETVAGALRLLWGSHRTEIVAAASK